MKSQLPRPRVALCSAVQRRPSRLTVARPETTARVNRDGPFLEEAAHAALKNGVTMEASESRLRLGILYIVLLVVSIPAVNTRNAWAQSNPLPLIDQPLVPASTAPGGPTFTSTVNGSGFVPASAVKWNGSALATSFVNGSRLTAAVPATDIAAASTASITVVNPTPGGGTSNVVFLSITLPTSSVAFRRSDFTTASGPESVAIGDFNGDGKLDLAVSAYFSSRVSILLGNGDGTFQPHVDYATGGYPSSVVARDFNGDGKLDLAVQNQGSSTISVFLGKGDGTFQLAGDFATASGQGRMIAGDFNGDGKLDLATTHDASGTVSILLGNGDGTFQEHVDYATGSVPFPIAVGDLNGDGKLDLIVGNAGASTFSVLLGNGDGTFQTHVDHPTITDPQSVVIADFNGDGKLDLAVFSEGDGTSILLGNGDGTFRRFADYATGCGSNTNDCTAAVGDLNGDGRLDLAVRNSPANTVSVLLGNWDGTFQTPLSFPTGSDPEQVTIADFNGDGRLDLVAANLNSTTVSVLLQISGGSIVSLSTANLTFGSQTVSTRSATQKVTLTNTGTTPLVIKDILDVNNADFTMVEGCGPEGASLAAGASCSIWVSFTPTQDGTRLGTLKFIDNAANSPQIVTLKGTGIGTSPIVDLAPSSPISFASQKVGTTSAAKTVQLINLGNATLNISSVAQSGDFAQTNNCPASLAPSASCKILITFTPTATGTRTGSVAITDNAPDSPQVIKLSGTGD